MVGDHVAVVRRVCAAWGRGPAVTIAPVACGGFSGAAVDVVALADAAGRFVLKPFAPHVPRDRAEWVHGAMRHARAAGVVEVPAPLEAVTGTSVVADVDGRLWELVRFVDGQPDAAATADRAAAAVDALARLHAAWRSWPVARPDHGRSPGVERRRQQAHDLLARPWPARWGGLRAAPADDAVASHARSACGQAADLLAGSRGRLGLLAVAEAGIGPLDRQTVVRDIWSDHVLFDPVASARVAGIVDFHAAGNDTPLTDIARLLGSWDPPVADPVAPAAGLTARWAVPLAAYERRRGGVLSAADRWLVDWLHAAGVICSLDNWFRWIGEDRRHFSPENRVRGRIERLLAALPAALDWLADEGHRSV